MTNNHFSNCTCVIKECLEAKTPINIHNPFHLLDSYTSEVLLKSEVSHLGVLVLFKLFNLPEPVTSLGK
jgi:hypothetical protein